MTDTISPNSPTRSRGIAYHRTMYIRTAKVFQKLSHMRATSSFVAICTIKNASGTPSRSQPFLHLFSRVMVSSMPSDSDIHTSVPVSMPLVAQYLGAKVAILRAGDYQVRMPLASTRFKVADRPMQETLSSAKTFIPALSSVPASSITLYTTTLPDHPGEEVLIPEGMWSRLAFEPYLKSIIIHVQAVSVTQGEPALFVRAFDWTDIIRRNRWSFWF